MYVSGYLSLFMAAGAVFMDIFTGKVDNRFILWGWLVGFGYQLGKVQEHGFLEFAAGAILPIAVLFILFLFRMLGPGDIKILSVLGGIIGAKAILLCMFYSFIFGAIFSLVFLIFCGNFLQRFIYFSNYMSTFFLTKKRSPYYITGDRPENIHFTVPILMGIMLYAGGFY